MERNGDIPKIAVDTKDDVIYLKQQLQEAAFAALAEKCATENSKTKKDVEDLMNNWIEAIFSMAGKSMLVNGQDYDQAFEEVEEIEPFDEELNSKLIELHNRAEELTLKVAERRKNIPDQIEKLMQDVVLRQSMLSDRVVFEGLEELENEYDMSMEYDIPREDSIKQDYEQSVKMLAELRQSLPGNLSRIDRAKTVLQDLVGNPSPTESTST
ncbi:uncharacterized protein VTP21DRAFT_1698 [Calcarisporiella thermophila]|uniref:uncharacterized protein n=1 Tax=Calcarisporiella thermophila TaxID=911321 RepID=UPI0037433082